MSSTSSRIRTLLRDDVRSGYPREFVLARLRGRRAALAGVPVAPAPHDQRADERIWGGFLGELGWLFRAMDRRLREETAPLFMLFEIKTIVLCLRNAELDRTEVQRHLLDRSLLSASLRGILAQRRHVGATVAALGGALGGVSGAFLDLDARYFETGLKGCEDALMRVYLEAVAGAKVPAPTRHFLHRFIDLRNLMALYKHQRWDIKGPIILIRGGTIETAVFREVVVHEDRADLDRLIARATGIQLTGAASELAVESRLMRAFGSELRRLRRERGPAWAVPEYMWSAYAHARNQAVVHHAAGLEPAAIAREMIA